MLRRPWGKALATGLVAATLAVCSSYANPSASAGPIADPPLDCENWRYGPADEPAWLPPEFDRDEYKRTSLRDPRPELFESPQNQCGQKGAAVDLAWGLSRGSDDVVIAVLDSGIRWRNTGVMQDLATKAHIDLIEAPPPCHPGVADGDCNSDGVFDIADFGSIADRNGNGVADPEDLILDPAYNDGIDDDGDGYVDDVSGWDFLYGDNDPFDTVDYGHGTGEALDSTAAENGRGDVGTCPRCRFIPVRVSDSFIADGGRFAAGVLFGLDQGADVVQEALGAISNPRQAQQAIDAAYERGVVVVASMADEASEHPNLPASLEHTMAVNSVTEKEVELLGTGVEGYLALNGCTNFGGHTHVSVPSSSCSSEATGLSAGMIGLLESYARTEGVAPHPGLSGDPGTNVLSANEAMQLVRMTADDIDFSTPNAVDPANNFDAPTGNPLIDTVRYPTRQGWDLFHGYGRINTYELLEAVRDGRIPPEAMIDGPSWFEVLPVTGTVPIVGSVGAARANTFDYRVEWAPGAQPPAHPDSDSWTVIASDTGLSAPVSGTLATLDLATVAAALPDGGRGTPVDPGNLNRPDEDRFAARLRVVVTAHGGRSDGSTGEMQKQIFVHDDPDLRTGFPLHVPGAGTSSPLFVDVDRDGTVEMVLGTDDGEVHVYRHDLTELPGFPASTPVSAWWPGGSPTADAEGIPAHHAALPLGGPAVGDVDGDGDLEVVATDLNGGLSVWSHTGQLVASAGVDPTFSQDDPAAQDERNRTKPGFASAPALGDLDGDGELEIVAAATDRHLYAWHGDGSAVTGFPVLLVDPAKVASIDPITHRVTFAGGSGVREGGELIATPAVADLTGDGRAEIVVGAQEQYVEAPNIGDGTAVLALLGVTGSGGNSRLYAIGPDGAYLPGWPVPVAQVQTELLPTIGDGVAMPAAIGDVDPASPGPEIMAASSSGPLYVLSAAGDSVYGTGPGGQDIPLLWTAGLGGEDAGLFGPNRNSDDLVSSLLGFGGPAYGDLTGDGVADVTAPTAGLTRLIDLLVPDKQLPSDDQLSAWDGASRLPLAGTPQAVADLAFFVAPAVADLDADGDAEMLAGSSTYTISAFDADGSAPAGWPKLTGGWSVGTPAVGDWDGDGAMEVAQPRRDGALLVWETAGTAAAQWSGWGCDQFHSGACVVTAVEPPPPPPEEPPATEPTTQPTEPPVADAGAEAAAAEPAPGSLPVTGRDISVLLLIALACLLIGTALRSVEARATARGQIRRTSSFDHGPNRPK
jgi:hypothetical protein